MPLQDILYALSFMVLTQLVLLLLLRLLQHLLGRRLSDVKNPATAIVQAGQLFACMLLGTAVVRGGLQGASWQVDLQWVALYGGLGVLLLAVFGVLTTSLLLQKSLSEELSKGNIAAGIAAAAHDVASAVILSSCFFGNNTDHLFAAFVFSALAQLSSLIIVTLFRVLTVYDDSNEVKTGNIAAAISYAGVTIAVGLLTGNASAGEFLGWIASLQAYGICLLFGFLFYPMRIVVVQTLLLRRKLTFRGGLLDEAIGKDKNVGLASLEASAYLSTAFLIRMLFS